MPSKIRRVISVLKDQTSIGIARVSRSATSDAPNLEIAVLKATSHDEVPINDRHANEVILLAASSSKASAALVHALSRRVSRTRCWIVALKSLQLAFGALLDASPYFPREAIAASSRRNAGAPQLLDVSGFSDGSDTSSPWDFTAFIRTFSLYLDVRLESYYLGKLHHYRKQFKNRHPVSGMKPLAVLDRIGHWQRLLQRAIAMHPTGAARANRLIKISLYPIVNESFDIYRDISDGLAILLDSFVHLPYQACLDIFHVCTRAARQFDELSKFYALCKGIGVGHASEYPAVQKISKSLLNSLEEFLQDSDAATMTPKTAKSPLQLLLAGPMDWSEDHRAFKWLKMSPALNASGQAPEGSLGSSSNAVIGDLMLFDEQPQAQSASTMDTWELVLVESASDISSKSNCGLAKEMKPSPLENLYDQSSYLNPFLIDLGEQKSIVVPSTAPPTFQAAKADGHAVVELEKDPFSSMGSSSPSGLFQTSVKQQQIRERQLWIQQQSKIIANNRF